MPSQYLHNKSSLKLSYHLGKNESEGGGARKERRGKRDIRGPGVGEVGAAEPHVHVGVHQDERYRGRAEAGNGGRGALGASGDEDKERNRHHGEQARLHLLRWVSGAEV